MSAEASHAKRMLATKTNALLPPRHGRAPCTHDPEALQAVAQQEANKLLRAV
jgi:hypothetical protein